jgi:DNA-binding transcriptional regulator YiaG
MATRKPRRSPRRTPQQQVAELEARIAELREQVSARKGYSAAKVRRERARLELSAADYGELIGVSGLTIYNWEKGKTRPRTAQLEAWLEVVGIARHEAWKRLGYA